MDNSLKIGKYITLKLSENEEIYYINNNKIQI